MRASAALLGVALALQADSALALVEGYQPSPSTYVLYTFAGCGLLFLAIITLILEAYRWLHYALLAAALVATKAATSGALPYWLGGSEFALWVVPYLVLSGATVIGYWVAGAQLEAPHPLTRYRKPMYIAAAASAIGPLTSYFWLKVIPLNFMWIPQLALFYSMYIALMVPPWTWKTESRAQAVLTRAYPIVGGIPFVLMPFFEEPGYGLVGDTAQKLELAGIGVQFVYVWVLAIWLGVSGQNARREAERAALQASRNEAELQLALMGAERDYERALSVARASQKRLATVSHDLKQPLASLRGVVDRLGHDATVADTGALSRAVDYVEGLARAYGVEDNEALEEEVLSDPESSDARHGGQEAISVALLCRSLEQMFSRQAEEQGVRLELQASESILLVPPLDAMRVLSNLIANAVQHARASVIVISEISTEGESHISVRDDGCGLSADDLQRLRLSGAKGIESSGDGLGLAIVEELCNAHGWTLRFASNPGEGTSATVTFPLAADEPQPVSAY